VENIDIARIFDEIADVLEIKDENRFRIRSYRRAARAMADLTEDARTLCEAGELTSVAGIGASLAEKIAEIIETGTCKAYEDTRKDPLYPLIGLLKITGVGPKLAAKLNRELGVVTVDDLAGAAEAGKLHSLEGLGEKSEEKILRAVEQHRRHTGRYKISEALPYAESIVELLGGLKEVSRVDIAGSLRRMKETIGDIDVLAISTRPEPVMEVFTTMDIVAEILARGETKSSVVLRSGMQVDLRVLKAASYGAALHYFTGSKEHNVALRDRAKRVGKKVSEYGVFESSTGRKLAGKDEKGVYRALGLPLIPPELRENRGEIEAAEAGDLPRLIEQKDIRGDLQMHTTASDGANSIEEMASYARDLGYEYIAITDHSQAVRVAGGLDAKGLASHIKAIHKADRRVKGIKILASVEVDIMADGSLDLPDEVLSECDMVLAAVHSGFNMPREEMTERVIRGISNPLVNILAHPTGRLINAREPYELDLDRLIEAARKHRVALEVNAHPDRLDLKDIHCRAAREAGVAIAINTDSHADLQLVNMRYGVATARRGWLEAKDVINTFPLAGLMKFFAGKGA
jgi:DNA polymerase (family 10)